MKIKLPAAVKTVGNTALSMLIAAAAQAAIQAITDTAAKRLAKNTKPAP